MKQNILPADRNLAPADLRIAKIDFQSGDVIWAKIKGSPFWPAKVERIYGAKNQMMEIQWFNDYRRSKIFKTQGEHFLENFRKNSKVFDRHIGLETAAKEAVLHATSTHFFEHLKY